MNSIFAVSEVIDLRSFSNLWYWIMLAVMWSSASHFVLGVPYDLVQRAKDDPEGFMADLKDLIRVNVNRLLYFADKSGVPLTLFLSFFLAILFIFAAFYNIEFAQALFLLLFPMTLVALITVRLAYKLRVYKGDDAGLLRILWVYRSIIQFLGMFSLVITVGLGMYQNIFGNSPF